MRRDFKKIRPGKFYKYDPRQNDAAGVIWDGRMLNYGLAGRSQNVLFNLYIIDVKIEYKKIYIFYSDPLPDLRPDFEASGYFAFAYTAVEVLFLKVTVF
jgi:hypothetical protein